MNPQAHENIIDDFHAFVKGESTPCVGAKGALAKDNISVMVADHFDENNDDEAILQFAYNFIREYRENNDGLHSMVIIFKTPGKVDEDRFEEIFWQRLQSLRNLDAKNYPYDKRVSADPSSPSFSFSLMEEAFFIIALHPASSRQARRFAYPALVFNPHAQFEKMRKTGSYEKMQKINRSRDLKLSGTINPMLNNYGEGSEVTQYSGRQYDDQWKCPLNNMK